MMMLRCELRWNPTENIPEASVTMAISLVSPLTAMRQPSIGSPFSSRTVPFSSAPVISPLGWGSLLLIGLGCAGPLEGVAGMVVEQPSRQSAGSSPVMMCLVFRFSPRFGSRVVGEMFQWSRGAGVVRSGAPCSRR